MLINYLIATSILSISLLLFYYAYFFIKLNTHKTNILTFNEPISIIGDMKIFIQLRYSY